MIPSFRGSARPRARNPYSGGLCSWVPGLALWRSRNDDLEESHMKVTGRCHCGQITFAAEVDASRVRVCHCSDCQALSGSAFRTNVPVLAGTFALRTGE